MLGVLQPGQHGSTFGGNPLACAVAREVIAMLSTGEYQERSAKLGAHCSTGWPRCRDAVRSVRARPVGGCQVRSAARPRGLRAAADRGVLAKDTHGTAIRLAPPLTISEADLDWALDQVEAVAR